MWSMAIPSSEIGIVPSIEELIPAPDPVTCCERLEGLPYRLFLDSAQRSTRLGSYSFLTADPAAVVRSRGARTEILDCVSGTTRTTEDDALTAVRTLAASHAAAPIPGMPPFLGGVAGFLAYDWGLTLERL